MAENTKIEWCDHTFNPWEGCTKVSPGCAHCYAEARDARWHGGTAPHWGKGAPRRRTSAENWKKPCVWNRAAGKLPEVTDNQEREWHRPRVFCASLADWLDPEVPIEWLADLLNIIHTTPHLDWLLLTKRPELWHQRITAVRDYQRQSLTLGILLATGWLIGQAPHNIWIGTTVEDQKRADERIPLLLDIPAKVRFLSCEPLLESVSIPKALAKMPWTISGGDAGIHWVIAGGESGRNARPMQPAWARSLRDQCAAAGVPFLFKQWGEWCPTEPIDDPLATCEAPGLQRLGKAAAGRLLDGQEWSQFPNSNELTTTSPTPPTQ